MNLNLLIEAIVRQTTVLIAQLATSGGGRTQLAGTANQVFLDLVSELKRQGVGTRVIADMFGLALRTYHDKVRRLEESRTARGRSLWEAVLEQIEDKGPVARATVLQRFRFDDEGSVKGVLRDLVDSGLVYRTGRGASTTYRKAEASDLPASLSDDENARAANFVWVTICRHEPVSREVLLQSLPLEAEDLDAALSRLLQDGRVRKTGEGDQLLEATTAVIQQNDPTGWEAAVFDHYQAMVTAICTRLQLGPEHPQRPAVGGSTFRFEVWQGHPMRDEVIGFLDRVRSQGSELRERLAAYNQGKEPAEDESERVLAYVGQTILSTQRESRSDND